MLNTEPLKRLLRLRRILDDDGIDRDMLPEAPWAGDVPPDGDDTVHDPESPRPRDGE